MRPMQSMFRRSPAKGGVPGLNLASMPDLIFTVLFFFMIVTHMRDDNLQVSYEVPAGSEVQKLEQKSSVVNIYIGRQQTGDAASGDYCVQVNGQVVPLSRVAEAVGNARKQMSATNAERLTVSLKADRHVPMGMIADVKQALQQSFALRVNYSGMEGPIVGE